MLHVHKATRASRASIMPQRFAEVNAFQNFPEINRSFVNMSLLCSLPLPVMPSGVARVLLVSGVCFLLCRMLLVFFSAKSDVHKYGHSFSKSI